jgi:hypothetical protein
VCGSQSSFLNNSDVICWVEQASKQARLPIALLLAQWIYEGAYACTSIAAQCNNPANANAGLFNRCSTSYTASSCTVSGDSGYAGTNTGLGGALMNADIYNAGYCLVASAYQNSTLTSGGEELRSYAESGGWPLMSNNTYNALYQLGNYNPVWASSHYVANSTYLDGASPTSNVPGSGLVYLIGEHNLAQYDYIYS